MSSTVIGIIMGSKSDLETMQAAIDIVLEFGVGYEVKVVSAHRTPAEMVEYASQAQNRGLKVIIAGAGGAAHLPGMVASLTTLPVIGVPVPTKHLAGEDSLYSIVQMPAGVPVATVGIGNSKNAGLLALRILGISNHVIAEKLEAFRLSQIDLVAQMNRSLI
jgi:5-(carboxyamino)imidazole ribonucleotide mutase